MTATVTSRRARALLLAPLAACALVLAACSDGSEAAGRSPDAVVTVNPGDESEHLPVPERRFFDESSPWNTRIVGTDRVDADSERMIRYAHERVGVIERPGSTNPVTQFRRVDAGLFINTERWTTPVVAGGKPTKLVCRQLVCGDGEDTQVLNVPTDIDPDPRYDGWFTIFDTGSSVAYDLWRARRENDGSISYNYMRKWDLDGPGFSAPYREGARGSGLPLFAGLIRPGELQSGEIDHALAISLPGPAQSSFVQPASSTDGNGRTSSIPEGARIRLRRDVVPPPPRDPRTGRLIELTRQQQRLADAIVACLRTYGAIVVDRAAVPTLYAQRDVTSGLIRGNELQGLRLDDFEVMDLGRRYPYPPEHAEEQLSQSLPPPSARPSAPPVEGDLP